jgi:hypothetical protein
MKILNNTMVMAKGKKYKIERWQGFVPTYTFICLEEDYSVPFDKTEEEVQKLIENGTILFV